MHRKALLAMVIRAPLVCPFQINAYIVEDDRFNDTDWRAGFFM